MSPDAQVAVLALGVLASVARARRREADPHPHPPRRTRAPGRPATWWAEVLDDIGVDGDPRRWARVALGVPVLTTFIAAARAGAAGGLAALVVVAVAAVVARGILRGRGARLADDGLPDLLEHAGRGVRSGLDLPAALDQAGHGVGGPHGWALREVVRRVEAGAAIEPAVAPWVAAHPRPPVRLVAAAVAVAAAAGGRPGRALDGIAATLRARGAVAQEARALASQAQASAAVLVALPLVVAVGGAAADARVADALLRTGWGRGCLAAALGLDAAGAWWMRRVVVGSDR